MFRLTGYLSWISLHLNRFSFIIRSANIYLFKVNSRNTRKRCEICSNLTKKHQNNVIDVVLVFFCYLRTYFTLLSGVCTVDFEQVNVSWEIKQSELDMHYVNRKLFFSYFKFQFGMWLIRFIWICGRGCTDLMKDLFCLCCYNIY